MHEFACLLFHALFEFLIMSGISGFSSPVGLSSNTRFVLKGMGNAVKSRGPDSCGEWFDENAFVGLSHRRLAIVELTDAGH